jgi:circadian clock protein KaiB
MKYILYLFITGQTLYSRRAIENLHQICEAELHGRYELNVIDILEDPQIAELERILATPTLFKKYPEPTSKIIGDLSDHTKVLLGLGLLLVRVSQSPSQEKEDI